MALRALRDGRELNYKTYFQYGELLSTEGACDVSFSADEGCVAECVTRCPWADEFARLNCVACGIFYCKEIDAAVVRGFNPYLDYELLSNLHTTECCAFRYRDGSIHSGLFDAMPDVSAKVGFDFHCPDVYHAFRHVCCAALRGDGAELMRQVDHFLVDAYGDAFVQALQQASDLDFEAIS